MGPAVGPLVLYKQEVSKMRNVLKLRISKRTIFSSFMNVAIVAGFIGLVNLPVPAPVEEMGDMESFIENQLELVPLPDQKGDLGAFIESLPKDAVPVIVVPKSNMEKREAPVFQEATATMKNKYSWGASLSDGKFEALSKKWKRGVLQVATDKRCDKYAKAFKVSTKLDPLLQKAHAIVESNCDATVKGAAGEVGIFQVMPQTCREMGVTGDYRDPLVNATCTEKYRLTLCATSKKKCTAKLMFLAHNRGIAGALRTANADSTEYLRKVDCAARVLRKQKCA